jgi:hypothetical protein
MMSQPMSFLANPAASETFFTSSPTSTHVPPCKSANRQPLSLLASLTKVLSSWMCCCLGLFVNCLHFTQQQVWPSPHAPPHSVGGPDLDFRVILCEGFNVVLRMGCWPFLQPRNKPSWHLAGSWEELV